MIYLDNAATTRWKPPAVGQAIFMALTTFGNDCRGTHKGSLNAASAIYNAREKVADLFHCTRPDHVVFTCNATEALNIAISGLIKPGDHVISTDAEHNSVLRPLYRLASEREVQVDFVPVDQKGILDYAAFERLLRPGTKAIVCAHASNLTGNEVHLETISEIAETHNLLLIVDAAQTAGIRQIDMQDLGIDVLCFTGHKGLMGPQGTGGLCIREGIEIAPFKVGGTGVQSYSRTQPRQLPTLLEAGTLNGHGIAGLSAAIGYINEIGLDRISETESALTRRFYEGVKEIEGVTVYGDFSGSHAPIVSLNIRDYDSGAVSDALSERYGIATRPGAHCAPRLHEALGTKWQGAVRFSFSYGNTSDEIDMALNAIRELSRK